MSCHMLLQSLPPVTLVHVQNASLVTQTRHVNQEQLGETIAQCLHKKHVLKKRHNGFKFTTFEESNMLGILSEHATIWTDLAYL